LKQRRISCNGNSIKARNRLISRFLRYLLDDYAGWMIQLDDLSSQVFGSRIENTLFDWKKSGLKISLNGASFPINAI
jgi:hypothetical protein